MLAAFLALEQAVAPNSDEISRETECRLRLVRR